MKNIFIYIFILFSTVTFAQLDEFNVKVDGLGCPFCAYGLEKKFKELKGIKKIAIEMKKGEMTFSYPSENKLTIEQVNKQVEKAGYTPVHVLITRNTGEVEQSVVKQATKVADLQTSEFKTYGNCDMCKARIERAALSIKGVQSVSWNKETKMTKIEASNASIIKKAQKAIANAGHDTELFSALKTKYESLPPCCLYKRKK